ncbi:MAG: ferrous iron transporter B, partial [Spirochaetaceae bacterium]|nr:ferrous iron transporter B [Spirochaetaceae bacterium]
MSEQGIMTIAVAGNPNSGKTTVFNALTGSRQRIGNWPGVTVEKKEGTFIAAGVHKFSDKSSLGAGSHSAGTATATVERGGENRRTAYRVVDLPGIYSIAASSEDEAVARDYLLSTEADLVVDVVDASNLQRNLFLTVQLIELGIPVIVVLNMMDMATKKGMTIDVEDLSRHLGCPVIPTIAIHKDEAESLRAAIHERAGSVRRSGIRITYSEEVESQITALEKPVANLAALTKSTPRWLALKVLEGDPWVTKRVQETSEMSHDEIVAVRDRLSERIGEELDVTLADSRYGFIHGLSRHISRRKLTRSSWTERIDNVVMNRFLAIPVFLAVMYAVFWVTISVGGAFIDFFDIFFGTVFVDGFGTLLGNLGAPQWL